MYLHKHVSSICFLDFETSGIDTHMASNTVPISIGAVFAAFQGKELIKIVEYYNLIKWDFLMKHLTWPDEMKPAFDVHKISLSDIKENGKWPYEIRQDLIEICLEIQEMCLNKRKVVILSDAPNFEMVMTEKIFGSRTDPDWPFYRNAWSIYPLFQMADVKTLYNRKPHTALEDAKMLYDGMQEVLKTLGGNE